MPNILERLDEVRARIGQMCSEGRPPRMTIPVREDDDDRFITAAVRDAAIEIDRLQQLLAEGAVRMSEAYKAFEQLKSAIELQGRLLAGESD